MRIFAKKKRRVEIKANDIFINNESDYVGIATEILQVFEFKTAVPLINVFENDKLYRVFVVETLTNNPNLTGQFLHASIRILPNSGVMIDGIVSKSNTTHPSWKDDDYEAIRLQPFFLSNANQYNLQLVGKGLFERGLHFTGTVTPSTVRNICICDNCSESFAIQHFHAGFSEVQYFYSSDSKETLIASYDSIEDMPRQLQENISNDVVGQIEKKLPQPSNHNGSFNYYNSFRCPHCLAPYIDFERHRDIRPKEYYGNTYINEEPRRLSSID